jgi:parallel beta-helix repeat protein
MKKAMVRPIMVRGVAAFALVGALVGVAAQSASASPAVKVFVRTNGSDTHSCLGASAAKACQSVSHATSVADAIAASETPPGSTAVIVEVSKGTYYDTIGNGPSGAATSPAGITISEPNITIQRKGSGVVTIEPTTTESAASVEDTTPQNVLVNVAPGVTGAKLSKLTINGINAQNSFTPGSQDFVGVFFGNSSGTLSSVNVLNVQQPAANFGDQPGANGDVYVVSCTSSCPSTTGTATMTAVKATAYDKTGIVCSGAATTCTISGSTVTGSGPLNDQAQNGIEDDFGAKATITSTTVSGDSYTCNGVLDGACYSASGILAYQDAGLTVTHSTVTSTDDGIVPYQDAGPVVITYNTVSNGTGANVGSAQGIEAVQDGYSHPVTISNNTVNGNDGGGIYNYATGPQLTEASNTTDNDSASETICTVAGPPISGCTTSAAGGGIINYGTTGGTVGPSDISENNLAGGVIDTGSTGGTIGGGAGDTISNNAAGGVLLQAATGVTVSNDTLGSNASGGVIASSNNDQSSNDTVTGSTVSGTSGAGVELQFTGGFTMTHNTVSGLGAGGEGFVLVGSSNNTITTNSVTGSAAGAFLSGNDLTGPSTNNTVSNNNFSSNLLGGGAADGFGSPESWNKPGTGNQGIQGEVFFQSDTAIAGGTPTSGTGAPQEVVNPTSFGAPAGSADYSGVAEYLAGAGAICGSSAIPVDGQGGDGGLYACTDGAGDIFLEGVVANSITAGNGEATGPSTTSEPGCESSPPANTGQPICTGTVLTLSDLPPVNTVAEGNTFSSNLWANETIAGAIDGSGPNGQFTNSTPTYVDGNPDNPAGIQNTWTNNTGDPSNSPCNPTTVAPACAA